MTSILWIVCVGTRLTFGTAWGLIGIFELSFVLSFVICSVYWVASWRKRRTVRSFSRLVFLVAICVCGTMCGIHYLSKTPTRFPFLAKHPIVLHADPAWPGFVQSTYSFIGNPEIVMASAASELASLGYEIKRHEGVLYADQLAGGKFRMDRVSVTISPGRVVGKHFDVDGDTVDIEHRRDWVTVEVFEPDVLPGWLRMLSP